MAERCKLYGEYEHFNNVVGFLIAHSRVLNPLESEAKQLRSSLQTANSALCEYFIRAMTKRLGGIPRKQASLADKVRYNDTVSRIKASSAKFSHRIRNAEKEGSHGDGVQR